MADQIGNVLAVDDDRMSLMLLSRHLKHIGHTVTTASNGRNALDVLAGGARFDVLILDCLMPEMDGYEVLEILRADPRQADLPVIMLSGVEDVASVVTCIELGATDYLSKPFDPSLLRARINNTLSQKRSRERESELFTDLQENYARLRELEAQRDNLMHMIVHDLRTPLTSVIGGLDALGQVQSLEGDGAELLALATRGSQSLLAIINELLDVHRMEQGLPIERSQVLLAELADAARDQVAALANQAGVELSVDGPEAGAALACDRSKIERVLVNLLGNAIKFTPRGGHVSLSASELGEGGARIVVRDDGEGIPPEALPRLFERFFQVPTRQGGRAASTGIGLTFCKMAIEAHGGTIAVESGVGRGSTFTVSLPRPA